MKLGSRILVIDDQKDFRELMKEWIESRGYLFLDAKHGQDGLDLMQTTQVDLVIVDLDMPVMNGLDFTIESKKKYPKVPVIMVTAYSPFYSTDEILSTGIDAFLKKPIELDTLMKTIQSI